MHQRTTSRTTSNGVQPHASHQQFHTSHQSSTHRPLTPQAIQAHDLHQVFVHQDPSYLTNLQHSQARLISTSLDTLDDFGRRLPEDLQTRVIYGTSGMAPMERFEVSSEYPLRSHKLVGTSSNPQNFIQDPHTTTPHPHQTSSTQVQPPSTESAYYPEENDEYLPPSMQAVFSSQTQDTYTYTYTSPSNTNQTHSGRPLSIIQFPNSTQSQNSYPQTINGYNKPEA